MQLSVKYCAIKILIYHSFGIMVFFSNVFICFLEDKIIQKQAKIILFYSWNLLMFILDLRHHLIINDWAKQKVKTINFRMIYYIAIYMLSVCIKIVNEVSFWKYHSPMRHTLWTLVALICTKNSLSYLYIMLMWIFWRECYDEW